MRGGLSPLPNDIKQYEEARLRSFLPTPLRNIIAQVFERALAIAPWELHHWTKNGIIFDVSLWQALKDKTTTSVRWDLLHHPKFFGGYYKWGEPWGNFEPGTVASQQWLDPTRLSNRRQMIANGQLSIGYIYHDTAWARNRAWTEAGIRTLFDGTISQVANKLLRDPNLYLLCLMLKDLTGVNFTAEQLKGDPDAEVDGIIWDVERHQMSNGQENGDFWNGLTLDTTLKGAEFLADNGFIPKQPIEVQTNYCSEWYLGAYGNVYTRQVIDRYDSIAAGYYWDENKVGYLECATLEDVFTLLDTISLAWHPYNIGAAKPGKIQWANQLMSNLTMKNFVTSPTGGPSAIDVNALNISKESLLARNPKWAKRIANGPPPDPDPTPTPTPTPDKKYWAVLKKGVTDLNLRNTAEYIPSTTKPNNIIYPKFVPKGPIEVTLVEDGNITWCDGHVYFAKRDGDTEYIDLTPIP